MSSNHHGPPPQRTKQFPNGLPANLVSSLNLLRLRSANRLYRFMVEATLALPPTTIWTIENPWRSWLWETSYFKTIAAAMNVFFVQFDMCMFGGKRLEHTAIATASPHLMQFETLCDATHQHLPYKYRRGKFDTATEAEYPRKFCQFLTQAVFECVQRVHNVKVQRLQLKQSQVAAIAVGKQPKAAPNLVSEFPQIIAVQDVPSSFVLRLGSKRHLTCCYKFVDRVHAGAKLLRRNSKKGGVPDAPPNMGQTSLEVFAKSCEQDVSATVFAVGCQHACKPQEVCEYQTDVPCDQVVFGIPWEPVQFVQKIAKAGHPRNIVSGLSDVLIQAADDAAKYSPNDLVLKRCSWLGKYVSLSKQLRQENEAILGSMTCEVREVMKCKKLALLRRMLQDEKYPDLAIVDNMCRGFDLVGDAPTSSGV